LLDLKWDETKLELIPGNLPIVNTNLRNNSNIRLIYYNPSLLSNTINFKIKEKFTSWSQLISMTNTEIVYKNNNSIWEFLESNHNIKNNAIVVNNLIWDVKNDWVINTIDLSLLSRKVTGLNISTTSYIDTISTADTNCDWHTWILDLALMQRYVTWFSMINTWWCNNRFWDVEWEYLNASIYHNTYIKESTIWDYNDIELLKVSLLASNDSINISDLYIANTSYDYENNVTGINNNESIIKILHLFIDDVKIGSLVPSNWKVHFVLWSANAIKIAKNSNKIITIKADLYDSSNSNLDRKIKLALYSMKAYSNTTGIKLDNYKINIDNSYNFISYNVISWNIYTIPKSVPIITIGTLDNFIANDTYTENEVYNFPVTADETGDIILKQFWLSIYWTVWYTFSRVTVNWTYINLDYDESVLTWFLEKIVFTDNQITPT